MDVTCDFCGKGLDPKAMGNYRKVMGWSQNRKLGGTNAITLPSEALGWAHRGCVEIAKSQRVEGQENLF